MNGTAGYPIELELLCNVQGCALFPRCFNKLSIACTDKSSAFIVMA